jgi:6-phospho-beta-glucosidase
MTGLRICVIGGGSVYTPELVAGFIKHKEELPIRALTLMDINERTPANRRWSCSANV